ncbi:MAG TPA: helix-turn-helix transcriptional regulator [Candidatus Binatia bacterium]
MYFLEVCHRTGMVVRGEDLVPDELVVKTAYFNEYLRKVDTLHHLGACLAREQSVLALLTAQRSLRQPSHFDLEERLVEALVPHLQKVVALQRRLAGIELERAAAAEALDRLTFGVCLLARDGRALLVNRAARAIFDQADGLVLGATGIGAEAPAARSRLAGMIARACRAQAKASDTVLPVRRRSGRRPYAVLVSPLRIRSSELAIDPPRAIAILIDPEQKLAGAEELLAQLYGLTPAEASIARLLADGHSVSEICDQLQGTANTTRTYIKRLFSKTGTRSQAGLVRLVLQLTGQLRRDRDA